MLRALTLERSQIKEAIGFALDNADAAEEVLFDLNHIGTFCFTDDPMLHRYPPKASHMLQSLLLFSNYLKKITWYWTKSEAFPRN